MRSLLVLMRPRQWVKSLMLLFPPFLGGHVLSVDFWQGGWFLVPLTAFSLASSATYIFNDIHDCDSDQYHPQKRSRPLPSGRVGIKAASVLCAVLLVFAFCLAFAVSALFVYFITAYIAISISYSLWLKHVPVVDLFCISSGFLLRLMAGGEAYDVIVSDWLFLSVFLLSLFLSAGKRIGEVQLLKDDAYRHRKSLENYPDGFLSGTMYTSAGTVLLTYAMYLVSKDASVVSVPLCMFGLLRYAFRVQSGYSGDPTDALMRDLPLLVTSLIWVALTGWSIYG